MLNDGKCNTSYMDPMRMIFPGHDNAIQMRYTWFVLLSRCLLDLFVRAPKFAQKRSRREYILALNPPKWAEIETSKFTFHPPNRLFCLHVSRRLKVTPQTLQLVNFYDTGICSQQKIANRKCVRCFGKGCFGVSRNVWIFWMFFLFLPNQSKAGN